MNSISRPRVITFDLGHVVVQVCRSFEEAAARAGIPWRVEQPSRHNVLWRLFEGWQDGSLADAAFFEGWCEALGAPFPPQDAAVVSAHMLIGEFPSVTSLIEQLHRQGHILGCLSNTCPHHWDIMLAEHERFPSLRRFTHRHASHLLGVMKPKADIYRRYEHAVGAEPDQIVFFDDLEPNVQAARERGWHAFLLPRSDDPAPQMRQALASLDIEVGDAQDAE